jgi:type II secretory pathway pseudopilin PulG
MRMRKEEGFTVVELMAGILIAGLLMTLGAWSLRNYWFTQSLERAKAEVVTQMRQAQQRAMSESHPLVYGVWFEPNKSNWGVVMYDPTDPTQPCEKVEEFKFEGGVISRSPTFAVDAAMESACDLEIPGTGAPQRYVFFHPRGSATAGSVTLLARDDDTNDDNNDQYLIEVKAVTGRVIAP